MGELTEKYPRAGSARICIEKRWKNPRIKSGQNSSKIFVADLKRKVSAEGGTVNVSPHNLYRDFLEKSACEIRTKFVKNIIAQVF